MHDPRQRDHVARVLGGSHLAIRTCLEAAVASEPDYAAAWAMLGWIHTFEYTQDHNKRPAPMHASVRSPPRAAPSSSRRQTRWRASPWRAPPISCATSTCSTRRPRSALLNPHEPFLLGNIGNWLAFTGRWDEGVAMIRKAIALNPKVYPRWWHAALGKDHYRKGEYRQALLEFKNMNLPNWWWNQVELAYTYGQLGDMENAARRCASCSSSIRASISKRPCWSTSKFSFEQSYIDLAVDGLRKAGVAERRANDE